MGERTVTLVDVVLTAEERVFRAFEAIYDDFDAADVNEAITHLAIRSGQPARMHDSDEYLAWFVLGALWGRYAPGMGLDVTEPRS